VKSLQPADHLLKLEELGQNGLLAGAGLNWLKGVGEWCHGGVNYATKTLGSLRRFTF
jgi:hypothetical protein